MTLPTASQLRRRELARGMNKFCLTLLAMAIAFMLGIEVGKILTTAITDVNDVLLNHEEERY
ncbi:hypothetical protein [Ruegeria jejuensis]|uniref:hypothetical protein n=1 Tax=Ruegeria jejuensis TaxID=3233338 RepID=UPI00355AE84B